MTWLRVAHVITKIYSYKYYLNISVTQYWRHKMVANLGQPKVLNSQVLKPQVLNFKNSNYKTHNLQIVIS